MSASTGVEVTREEARRIAARAQLLDGSATDVLDTVRRLGFLQIDPISVVAPPQYLVLWSRLGPYDRAELDRLPLEGKVYEGKPVNWAGGELPLNQGEIGEGLGPTKRDQWAMEF